ncbi:hypothetical protein niasHS_016157 [Heterodera schachtii]|uniref:Secreted protein n=1 Tax=Heterodera schachtii TaxID=97005 RepID=A0ABD2HZB8_HETSC
MRNFMFIAVVGLVLTVIIMESVSGTPTGTPKATKDENDHSLNPAKNNDVSPSNLDDIVTPWTVSATSSKGIDYEKLIGA